MQEQARQSGRGVLQAKGASGAKVLACVKVSKEASVGKADSLGEGIGDEIRESRGVGLNEGQGGSSQVI